jgi:hypothetical protein
MRRENIAGVGQIVACIRNSVGTDFNPKDKAPAADGRPRDVAYTGVGGDATAKYNREGPVLHVEALYPIGYNWAPNAERNRRGKTGRKS